MLGLQRLFTSHILLYHSTAQILDAEIINNSHNVDPINFRKSLIWYKNNFDIVDLDELIESPSNGKVAITFDDAFNSVFKEAIPILQELNAPATIFINGASFEGELLWRTKVNYLIENNLVDSLISSNKNYFKTLNIDRKNIYKQSKSKFTNSIKFVSQIDNFIKEEGIALNIANPLLDNKEDLIDCPLIKYGNHTYNHFLLSSLSEEEQFNEINKNKVFLESLGLNLSNIFAVPFGDIEHLDEHTCNILDELGYSGLVLSRNRINAHSKFRVMHGIPLAERYMVGKDNFSNKINLMKLLVKIFLS